ncbi:MAG: putative transposase [Limisphaerales bacterium]
MNNRAAPSLFKNPETNTGSSRTHINPCLWFDDCDGYRVIFCRHEILYRVAVQDSYHVALVAVMLRQSELATQAEIAAAFGHAVATQRRWETRYRQHGPAGLLPKRPTGRHATLDGSQVAFVKGWFQHGVSNREMARRLGVSEATIRRVLQQAGLRRQTTPAAELPWEAAAQAPAETPFPEAAEAATAAEPAVGEEIAGVAARSPDAGPVVPAAAAGAAEAASVPGAVPDPTVPTRAFTIDRDPTDRSGDRCLARQGLLDDAAPLFGDQAELPQAGVLLAVPVLQAHGGLEVFRRLYGSLGPAFYGLRTTVLSLVLLALLRIKRPENVKEYSPERLGCLLGLDRVAEVKTLRRKLTLLAARGQGHALMNELARLRLAQNEDRVAFLYLDGHVREYSGQEPLAKTKKAQRSVATCAATDTWLHDADGAPLLVVTSAMNAGLTQVLEAIVAEAQELVSAERRLTVLFDRGGWSVRLFARLIALGVDVITYRKGKRRPVPRSRFSAHRVQEDGQDKTYWLYDQPRVRVGRLRPHRRRRSAGAPEYLWLRQITVLRDDGRQTVIVTNRSDLTAVEVVRRLFRRWRQENYFKYMDAEFALDALVEYGVEEVPETATRPNPARKGVAKQRQQAKAEVTRLRAELGAEAAANQEQQRPTMRGFKVAQARLRQRLKQAELREQALAEQLRQLPKRVPAQGLKTLKKERKLIVDAIKIIAYHCETALLDRLGKHYARADDEGRTLLQAAFQSSASMEVTETELKITIAAQSSPHRSEALAKLCRELDVEPVYYPGSSLRVRLAVAGQEPLIT